MAANSRGLLVRGRKFCSCRERSNSKEASSLVGSVVEETVRGTRTVAAAVLVKVSLNHTWKSEKGYRRSSTSPLFFSLCSMLFITVLSMSLQVAVCDRSAAGLRPALHLISPKALKPSPEKLLRQQQRSSIFFLPQSLARSEVFNAVSGTRVATSPPAAEMVDMLPIGYEGGKVMVKPIKVYVIFYGPRWRKRTRSIIRDFIRSLTAADVDQPSVSNWWATLREYYNADGERVTSKIKWGEQVRDRFASYGLNLKEDDIPVIITCAINNGQLPLDPDGMYLFLTDQAVKVEGFCTEYCGSHFFIDYSTNTKLVYAHVGNPSSCPQGVGICSRGVNTKRSPNGFIGMDAMVWSLGHEMAEMATDPHLDGWMFPVHLICFEGSQRSIFIHAHGPAIRSRASLSGFSAYSKSWSTVLGDCKCCCRRIRIREKSRKESLELWDSESRHIVRHRRCELSEVVK